jgi:hypothetical protein
VQAWLRPNTSFTKAGGRLDLAHDWQYIGPSRGFGLWSSWSLCLLLLPSASALLSLQMRQALVWALASAVQSRTFFYVSE